MNFGPDEGETTVDHRARVITFEMEYNTTGTLSDKAIRYLIDQAKWAIRLDEVGLKLSNAAKRLVASYQEEIAELRDELITAHSEISIMRESLANQTPKAE